MNGDRISVEPFLHARSRTFLVALRRRACLVGAAVLLLGAAPARAQAPSAAGQAKELFQQGREAVQVGDHAKALVLFRKSQALYPIPGTLLNMAICEEKVGEIASAWQHYHEVAAGLP